MAPDENTTASSSSSSLGAAAAASMLYGDSPVKLMTNDPMITQSFIDDKFSSTMIVRGGGDGAVPSAGGLSTSSSPTLFFNDFHNISPILKMCGKLSGFLALSSFVNLSFIFTLNWSSPISHLFI